DGVAEGLRDDGRGGAVPALVDQREREHATDHPVVDAAVPEGPGRRQGVLVHVLVHERAVRGVDGGAAAAREGEERDEGERRARHGRSFANVRSAISRSRISFSNASRWRFSAAYISASALRSFSSTSLRRSEVATRSVSPWTCSLRDWIAS